MTRLAPTPAEAASLRFLLPVGGTGTRLAAAACLFAVGLLLLVAAPGVLASALGGVLVLAAHLVLWVRSQTNAPGGSTPAHEEVWAPVEDDWLERVSGLEARAARWDVTPWDVSNGIGFLTLAALLGALGASLFVAATLLGPGTAFRLGVASLLLFVPLWFNGMRTTWNPSELRKKGEALAVARDEAAKRGGADFDVVPMLALREGPRGKYPVDARTMMRPAREDATGFLGVQVQVSLNNVRGTDYPYLYCVVLGKEPFTPPAMEKMEVRSGVVTVFEPGRDKDVRYLVVRQHADRKGGWHTDAAAVRGLVATAIDLARDAWQASGAKPA